MVCTIQVLVCAPSNVAVDQLAEKISATGLKVIVIFLFLFFSTNSLERMVDLPCELICSYFSRL